MKKQRFLSIFLLISLFTGKTVNAQRIHAVTDVAHEFSFYGDHRFHSQYLDKDSHGATNWCNLYGFDFTNANLLVLLNCAEENSYVQKDIDAVKKFLNSGGGVVMFGNTGSPAQAALLKQFGVEFSKAAEMPMQVVSEEFPQINVEGNRVSTMMLNKPKEWKTIVADKNGKPVLASSKVGKGTLIVASRSLAGSNPNATDSINVKLWKPLLKKAVAGKKVYANKPLKSKGIESLEHTTKRETFTLRYNDYLKPYAEDMINISERCLPVIEKRMGVPLAPGMGSTIALLATGGGGFSSGHVIALAVWWGGFPQREDGMIEFLTHESVHSWVLPMAEVWNEPIATYVGNLVMCDMGHEEEGLKRINAQIASGKRFDPNMDKYDLDGIDKDGKKVESAGAREVHWGKTYYIFEVLRTKYPDVISKYFKKKRELIAAGKITKYNIHNTVAVMSLALGEDLFPFFNSKAIKADKTKAEVSL